MQLKNILTFIAILFSFVSLNAQSALLKTITSGAKASATNKVLETADKTINKTLDNLLSGNMLKKKAGNSKKNEPDLPTKEQESTNSNVTGATELSVSNTDYASIVALAGIIKSNKNVSDIQRAFSNGSGTITVTHNGQPDELLDDILKKTSGKYEVVDFNKNKITLKSK